MADDVKRNDRKEPQDPARLIEELRTADFEEGTEASAFRLAIAELDTGIDVKEGLLILNQLANGGNTGAIRKFAELFEEGRYYKKDAKRALQCLKKADELGDAEAAYLIGRKYRLGLGVQANEKQAIRYFFKAADRGHTKAEYQLAVACFGAGQNEEGAEALKRCYEAGLEEAGYDYAMCLLYGDGLPRNTKRAVAVLEELAKKGDEEASAKLAFMYRNGFKVEKDEERAKRYKDGKLTKRS